MITLATVAGAAATAGETSAQPPSAPETNRNIEETLDFGPLAGTFVIRQLTATAFNDACKTSASYTAGDDEVDCTGMGWAGMRR